MPFPQIIRRSWLVVLLATWPGIVRSQEQAVRLETVTVVADRLPWAQRMSRFPAPSSVAKKDRTFNTVLQPVPLRRTGRSVIGWSAWRRGGAFGLPPAGLWVAVGALG
jgi:hypothetical protein